VGTGEAKRLFHEGVELLSADRWAEAEDRFRRSVELTPRASSLYNWALALLSLQRYRECIEVTDRLLTLTHPLEHAEYRQHATELRERAQAAEAQPVATPPAPLAAEPPAAQPPPVTPPAPGLKPSPATIPLAVAPAALASPDDDGIAPGWYLMSGGAVLLVGALVAGLLANAADEDFVEQCPDARDCDPRLKSIGERAERFAIATDILLATSAAAVGTGVTVLLLDSGELAGSRKATRVSGVALSLRGNLQ
jgi:hypothetical protein